MEEEVYHETRAKEDVVKGKTKILSYHLKTNKKKNK